MLVASMVIARAADVVVLDRRIVRGVLGWGMAIVELPRFDGHF